MNLNTHKLFYKVLRNIGLFAGIILLTQISFSQTVLLDADFESDTPGNQPAGWGFSPSTNDATNGAVVVDATTPDVNPLPGNSLYVYDLNGDGSGGVNTNTRNDFATGTLVSAARVAFTFQPMYESAADDGDTRITFTVGNPDLSLTNSDFRLFEFRIQNNGKFRMEYSRDGVGGDRGSSEVGAFDVNVANELVAFINSHSTETIDYDDGTLSGSLAPNMIDIYINGALLGSWLTLKTPDPANAPQIDFWATDADLGRLIFYQDSKRQGGVVFDDITVTELEIALPPPPVDYLLQADFEGDTPGDRPGGWGGSPSTNDATNGAVVVDATTPDVNPLPGNSLYVYDLNGDGSSGVNTNTRYDFATGTLVPAARVAFTFQPMYESAADDGDTRITFTVGNPDLSLTNSDFRLFEFRIQNNGKFRMEYSRDGVGGDRGSSEVGAFDVNVANELVAFINSHSTATIDYDDGTVSGSLAPNMIDIYINGTLLGSWLTLKTPDPANAPQIDFWATDADLGRIIFYQDSKRQGGVVFDDITVMELDAGPPPPMSFGLDFEADTPGEQPGGDWTFSPGTNDATNGAVVVDATTPDVNPLPGQSLYVYDLNGDGSSGVSTHARSNFLGGDNISAAKVMMTFQPMYLGTDSDTRVHFSIGQSGMTLNNSDFRLFEVRMQNDGVFRVEYSRDGEGGDRGSSEVGAFNTDAPNELVLFINSHGSESVQYNDGTADVDLAPNMMDIYLNSAFIGSFLTLKTPDPANAPQIDFWASDADLGQIAFYQDSKRQGGIVFDDIMITEIPVGDGGGGEPVDLEVFIDNFDFESETVGDKPIMPFPTSFSPGSNTEENGFIVVDAGSTPPNPMDSGQALFAYDFAGDLTTGTSSHMRFDFAPANTDNVRVDFDFQRSYDVPIEDTDTRIHIAVAPAGVSTNNSDFRPFEIRVLNNGTIWVDYNPTGALLDGRTSEEVATYETTGTNQLTYFANGNNATALPFDDDELGAGVVPPNTMVLFLNGTLVGEYLFLNTPDSVNAPQVKFWETTDELGRFAIYQDSKRQGGIVFDNLSIQEFGAIGPPIGPSDLTAAATGPQTIELAWTDNSTDEIGFIIERLDNATWNEVTTVETDVTMFEVGGLNPELEYTFRVLSTNGTPSDPSNEASATTEVQLLPIISMDPEGQLIPLGSSTDLMVEASGPGTLTYQWYMGDSGDTGSPVSGATSTTLTTGQVDANTAYWAQVTNDNGSADSAAALVEVFEPRVIRIVSIEQLEALLPSALPGDTYVMDAGTYPDAQISFEATGSEFALITLKAEIPGEVIFTGDSHLRIGGEWLVVEGFLFTDGWNESLDQVITFRTSSMRAVNCRVTECAIIDFSPPDSSIDTDWVGMYGNHNRFDHNYVAGHSNKGVTLVVWRNPGVEDNHRIDSNHFAYRASGGGENGWETIRIGTSGDSQSASKTIVEYNLFEECDGEIEIISNKSNENIYRYNTFLRCQGTLALRHGNECIVEGNVFLGEGVSNTGGIRVIGENHTIINNYIEGTDGRAEAAISIYAGVENSPLNEYFAAHGAFVGNNTIVDVSGTHIKVGAGYPSSNRTVLPEDVIVTNNLSTQFARSSIGGPVIDGEAVPGQTYAGNMYHASVALGTEVPGFTEAAIMLEEADDMLLRPIPDSATTDAADAGFPLDLDLDGQARTGAQDVGADEISDADGINLGGPLQPEDVGPAWLVMEDTTPPWVGVPVGECDISPWFGQFCVSEDGWIQHSEQGWLYVESVESTESMWMFNFFLDRWIWSSRDYFPVVYDPETEHYIYYFIIPEVGAWVYDYADNTWTLFPS